MGRSVNYLTDAKEVTYFPFDEDEKDQEETSWHWNDLQEDIQAVLEKACPSLYETDDWDGNEVKIILRNTFAEIGIAEYCGLVSLSVRVNPDYYEEIPGQLAENWIALIWPKVEWLLQEKLGLRLLQKDGSLSNGEGVYSEYKTLYGRKAA